MVLWRFYENNYIFISRQAYRFDEPKRGDIIVFHSDLKTQTGKEKLLIKRIVAIPGDVVNIADGKVMINGELQTEDYTLEAYTSGWVSDVEVPEDSLFVMGDNRQNSTDSRDSGVGFVAYDDIVGKAFFRLYPFNKIGSLN